MYPTRSVTSIKALIQGANQPNWTGNQGLAAMMYALTEQVATRGILVVNTVEQMTAMSGEDSPLVLVKGKAAYRFNPNASGAIPDLNIPGNAGQWEYLFAAPGSPYRRAIGDNSATQFTVTHNLATAFPTVSVFNTQNAGVNSFPMTIATDYTVEVVDVNTIRIIQTGIDGNAAAPWAGTSRTVVVKP